ncbi:hydrolase [Clostridium polyendosporum]|uniref:Hydrolase n=1 Tax=Clostridium polyendosporum TaxID=69208 RepID=A0A919VFX7_9CLOT|nr:MBL fold metallo-hydrolase [Clostridium polyendosporum]GIM28875.1 hydrolase [Clostridium polyendosporum]
MNKFNVRVNYLYNSGFCIETKKHLLIFDYYLDSVKSNIKNKTSGIISEEDLKTNKQIVVFSSHSHEDHFNPVIFNWALINSNITYVLSSDIESIKNSENIKYMSPYNQLKLNDLVIKSYGSTDIGISFLINVDGVNLFHAGDLNWWHWWDESQTENEMAETNFKNEIEKIKGEKVDIAFFPVDPRLKEDYYLGGEYFIKEVNPKIFIPMHFGEKYETTKIFTERVANSPTKVIEITNRGQDILL